MTANTTAPALRAPERLLSFDLLRLVAVALVLGAHMEAVPAAWTHWTADVLRVLRTQGGLGVDLFFVLSGVLVSGLIFAEYKRHGEFSLSRFYIRRAWRIYPPFYAFILFTYLYSLIVVGWKIRDREVFSELLFLQSYQQGYWNHTWTLAVEEHFYLLLPLVLMVLTRIYAGSANPFRAIPAIVGGTAVALAGVRAINYLVRTEYSFHTHAWNTHLRIDALFFGVAIAYVYHFHRAQFEAKLRPLRYPMVALGAALLTTPVWLRIDMGELYNHSLGYTQNFLGAGLVVAGLMLCDIPRNRLTLSLAALGAYSYSIYLWHMALMYWALPHLQDSLSWAARTALYVVGAFVIGVAMAKIVELPLLKLRDRRYPSRSSEPGGIVIPPTAAPPATRAA
jgi:peptidoglycan/LPS O-acetylase OafA/YrhL